MTTEEWSGVAGGGKGIRVRCIVSVCMSSRSSMSVCMSVWLGIRGEDPSSQIYHCDHKKLNRI